MAQLSEVEASELQALEGGPNRLPEDKRIARARLRFKRDLPQAAWDELLAAKVAEMSAIKTREKLDAVLRKLAPDDDEVDLLWWVNGQIAEAAAAHDDVVSAGESAVKNIAAAVNGGAS